ncbi:unnamed protein product [Scytosiphon promiscuus]
MSRNQPKHPFGRRNTYISSYTRHGLGFATADRDESLTTTKFRDLPLRERRLYTLTLGYGLRDDDESGLVGSDRRQRQAEMSRGHAVSLMARLHEMLQHGGRTLEGIFLALGVDTSYVYEGDYKIALEHISVRAGTTIPTGSAERALASLYRQREEAWPFLAERLAADTAGDRGSADPSESGTPDEADKERDDVENAQAATTKPEHSADEGGQREKSGKQKEQSPPQVRKGHGDDDKKGASVDTGGEAVCESFSLPRVSTALEAFARACVDRGCPLDDFDVQDLENFLYLGGQAKARRSITLGELQDVVEKHGRWAVERARRKAKEVSAKHTEAQRNAASGKAFALTDEQLNAAVDFLDPNQDGNIDLDELMRALKQDRTAKSILKKDDHRERLRLKGQSGSGAGPGSINHTDIRGSDDDGHDPNTMAGNSAATDNVPVTKSRDDDLEGSDITKPGREEQESSKREGETSEAVLTEQGSHRQQQQEGWQQQETGREDHNEERPLFSPQEAESLAAFLVDSQKAFSLINVADIQHGLRAAKRAEALVATRNVYRGATERFAAELRGAGMVLESDEGWNRWFDTCELGLRAGAAGTKRLVGRNELRRGLRALSAPSTLLAAEQISDGQGAKGGEEGGKGGQRGGEVGAADSAATLPMAGGGGRWSEQDLDNLLNGVTILGGGGAAVEGGDADGNGESGVKRNDIGKDIASDLTDVEFRERLMVAIDEGGMKADREMEEARRILPLSERLQSYLKENGMRLSQLFEQMVAWSKEASQEDLMQRTPSDGGGPSANGAAGSGSVYRWDDSCVSPVALRAILISLRTGGLTATERAKIKAGKKLALKEKEKRKVAKDMSAEATKRVVEADTSGASVVLALLRASVASKSIRVVELFKAMDTSKDGLISRRDYTFKLRQGLTVIAEGAAGKSSSLAQLRGDCKKRKISAAMRETEEKELRRAIKLRERIAAAEASGAAKVLRRIHEHLVQTGHKVVDMFHSFSLRGNLTLTTAELEMALSLVDGLEVTRREVRSVVRFLDKDNSGTIDVAEVDEAIRDFRELSRDLPTLGIGPLTVLDSAEINRLARRTFAHIAARRACSSLNGTDEKDGGAASGLGKRTTCTSSRGEGGRTISVADISEAFREAFQQFKAEGDGKHSIGAMRHPGTQQPSTDTQHAQACVDKVMEWLRSSRTFDRAPTGRVPTLAEQMTERQKMELELQNKLQEKRRRAAGQRHWEQWVSQKARRCKPGSKDQDEAFAAWAREKDRILRASKREKRRAITAGGLNTLEAINKKLRGARCTTPSRLPRLGCRSNGGSLASDIQALDGGGDRSVTTGGSNKGVHGGGTRSRAPMMKKAELKALDLAVTRVAVSPYRVRAKEKYQHSKHIEGGEIVTRMARNGSKPFPKALVEEGWQATSLLLGSASMSLIDHPTARHAAAAALGGYGSERGSKRDDNRLAGDIFVNNNTPTGCAERRGSARRHEQEQRPPDHPSSPGAVAPSSRGAPYSSAGVAGAPGNVSRAPATSALCSGSDRDSGAVSFVVPPYGRRGSVGSGATIERFGGSRQKFIGGTCWGTENRNSRGAPEGTGHGDGLDGTARGGGVGGGASRRRSSNSDIMEFPIQSQELPDWADTIKDLPLDDPYEEGEDEFEPDDELTSPPTK